MRVLLAVDGSELSAKTVNVVASHCWPPATEVQVLSVVDTPIPTVAILSADTENTEKERLWGAAEELTTRYANWLCSCGLNASGKIVSGNPSAAILEESKSWNSDLIVVGSHGHTGMKQWLLGSVAQSVVNQAPCSVFVVRLPDHKDQSRPTLEARGENG